MSAPATIGLFVGGAGKRMGGVAKGLLAAPGGGQTLIERLLAVCARSAPDARLYLVGQSTPYAGLGLTTLHDDPAQVGPIGGLQSLLRRARDEGSQTALALACDLPFIDESIISALLQPLNGVARVPFVEGYFQPLSAAYAPAATLVAVERSLALGKHALRHVLEQLGSEVERIEFDALQAPTLRDWDSPEDMQR